MSTTDQIRAKLVGREFGRFHPKEIAWAWHCLPAPRSYFLIGVYFLLPRSLVSTIVPDQNSTRSNGRNNERPDLFTSGGAGRGRPQPIWNPQLTRKLRVLLHAEPLLAIRRGDAFRDEGFRHYDFIVLALKLFDVIVERMGLEHEIDLEETSRVLWPVVRAMDAKAGRPPSPERHAAVVERLLAALQNDSGQRRPFRFEYQDFEDGEVVERAVELRLVELHEHPDGRTVLRLSKEALNFFLNILNLDIESAQAATEAVAQSQFERGLYAEAVETANIALIRTLQYKAKIEGILGDTRRDIRRVDWYADAPSVLNHALDHVVARMTTEQAMTRSAEQKLETLPRDSPAFRQVAQLARQMESCAQHHLRLEPLLIKARTVFLDEQDRQSFVGDAIHRPALLGEVLQPLMGLGREVATKIVDEASDLVLGGRPQRILSLRQLMQGLLQPRREVKPRELWTELPEPTQGNADTPRFSDEVRERALGYVHRATPDATLGSLLQEADAAGEPAPVLEYVALELYQAFAPDPEAGEDELLAREAGRPLHAAGFGGDDLILSRAGA
jgi:hypothetical protein